MHHEFEEHFKNLFKEDYKRFIDSINEAPKVSYRLNSKKLKEAHLEGSTEIPWSKHSFFLNNRPAFYADPLHHAGAYYVQESSSMFFSQFIHKKDNVLALDLCASPGGKSTLILNELNAESFLLSNELDLKRNRVLVENLNRWGNANVAVSNANSNQLLAMGPIFDLVVVDAPCSGEGMFRKDPVALEQWSPNFVQTCANIQKTIIADAYELTKVGGTLIYSTCTFEPSENELQIKNLIEQFDLEPIRADINSGWGAIEKIVSTYKGEFPCYYFYLQNAKGEGQFVCALRKKGESKREVGFKVKKELQPLERAKSKIVSKFIEVEGSYLLTEINGVVHAFPKSYLSFVSKVKSYVPLWKLGLRIGEVSGKNFKPHHDLAMSYLVSDFDVKFELEYKDAIDYLKRNPLKVKGQYKTGWGLATYKGVPLGWAKNIGSRLNNYFPKELALRKDVY